MPQSVNLLRNFVGSPFDSMALQQHGCAGSTIKHSVSVALFTFAVKRERERKGQSKIIDDEEKDKESEIDQDIKKTKKYKQR